MLRQYLCHRFRPKCIFTSLLVFIALSIALGVIFTINHDVGQSHIPPIDHLLQPKQIEDRTKRDGPLYIDDVNSLWPIPGRSVPDESMVRKKSNVNSYNIDTNNNNVKHKYSGNNVNDRMSGNVLSLLKMMKPPSTSKPVGKKVVNAHVDFLYQAIVKDAITDRHPLTFKPKCAGGLQKWEAEDLLCIPRPKFLDNIKNPCWYNDSTILAPSSRPLHCLPYFHILGVAKAGTTDLWNRMMAHPHIISNDGLLHKEALWWAWRRFGVYGYKKGVPQSFRDYVSLFQDTARLIQSSINNNNHYQKMLITGDASPPDFWDFRGWRNISQNRGLSFPQVMTPHLMHHFYPDPKFILMFKDPIDRLYSDYFFLGGGLTSEDFHRDIVQAVMLLSECVKRRDLLTCFYDNTLYYQMKVRLPFGCYSVFMREWLRVFPLKQFMFIKTEDYEVNPEKTLKDVISFLGLTPLKKSALRTIADEERSRITEQKKIAGPMKEKTKALLSRLLAPCSQNLAKMIGRSEFVWDS